MNEKNKNEKKMNEKNNVMKRIRGWIWTVNCLGSI